MEKIDIHNFERKYKSTMRKIENSELSDRNKELIKQYNQVCILEGIKKTSRVNILSRLRLFCERFIEKDIDKLSTQDLRVAIIKLENENFTNWTKTGYKAVIKKFMKWLHYGDNYKKKLGYPRICSWINATVKRKDQPILRKSDLLTEEEIKKLIEVADHPRDKAFISTLYELGARVSEHGNRIIKDVVRDEYGYIFDLEGKTGGRSPRIVMSAPFLTAWLNIHPERNNPNAPLWVIKIGDRKRHMRYSSIQHLLRSLLDKAGIIKRVYPHLFRHSRATHCLANGWMNESQAKVYFGWTPDSNMLSRYAHLTSEDANKAVLKMSGIETGERKESILKPKQCLNCKAINQPDALFCNRCTCILDVKTSVKVDETRNQSDKMMTEVLKKNPKLVEQILSLLIKDGLGESFVNKNLPNKNNSY